MAGMLDMYNADVLAIPCPRCGVGIHRRCQGRSVSVVTGAHTARLHAAGYRWDRVARRLEVLADGE